eukprot:31483-Pelagococcus_subviridis.AAC.10
MPRSTSASVTSTARSCVGRSGGFGASTSASTDDPEEKDAPPRRSEAATDPSRSEDEDEEEEAFAASCAGASRGCPARRSRRPLGRRARRSRTRPRCGETARPTRRRTRRRATPPRLDCVATTTTRRSTAATTTATTTRRTSRASSSRRRSRRRRRRSSPRRSRCSVRVASNARGGRVHRRRPVPLGDATATTTRTTPRSRSRARASPRRRPPFALSRRSERRDGATAAPAAPPLTRRSPRRAWFWRAVLLSGASADTCLLVDRASPLSRIIHVTGFYADVDKMSTSASFKLVG